MTKKQLVIFTIAQYILRLLNFLKPNFIENKFNLIIDIFRCASWRLKLKRFGNDSFIHRGVVIHGSANVELGDRVAIGEYCYMWGNAGISIGDDTLIAAGCQITTLSHDDKALIYRKSSTAASISIGRNVWLGFGVKVMPGISIGPNSIIGAGSVVTRNIPANVVALGAPARVIRVLTQHSPV